MTMRQAPSAPRMRDFRYIDVSARDWPGPMDRLRAIPLIAELKDLDLRPYRLPVWPSITRLDALSRNKDYHLRGGGSTGAFSEPIGISFGHLLLDFQALCQLGVGIAAGGSGDERGHDFLDLAKLRLQRLRREAIAAFEKAKPPRSSVR